MQEDERDGIIDMPKSFQYFLRRCLHVDSEWHEPFRNSERLTRACLILRPAGALTLKTSLNNSTEEGASVAHGNGTFSTRVHHKNNKAGAIFNTVDP